MNCTELFNQALEHHRAGRVHRAESDYRQVLRQDPTHDRSHYLLGLIALDSRQLHEALELFKKAIEIAPDMPAYHVNLGVTLYRMQKHRESLDALHVALSLKPDLAEGHFNAGLVLRELGHTDLAFQALERAAEFKPDNFDIQFQLAQALVLRREPLRAIGHFHCALSLNPKSLDCLVELGAVLRSLGRTRGATALAQRAIAQHPESAVAHNELGTSLLRDGQVDEAIAVLRKATSIQPDLAEAHVNLGNALGDAGRLIEGIEAYRRALELRPDWSTVHSNLIYVMPFAPGITDEAICQEVRVWNETFAAPVADDCQHHDNDRDPERRLRVGYFSPHFYNHCQSFFTLPLLTQHSRAQVEVFCYSSNEQPDNVNQMLRSQADVWRDTAGLDDVQLARLIHEDHIDVLVDLSLHMENGRLPMFTLRPAPVQMCWLAYPGTTGVRAIDYRITDPHLAPPERLQHVPYSERSIVLPNTFWCYDPLDSEAQPSALPALSNGYVTFGSTNHFRKINEGVIQLWARVLNGVENSRITMFAPQGDSQTWVRRQFERAGIAPERIAFSPLLPRQDYLRMYRQIDICLDTFPYGGHTTSLDAFWMGVPVVALVGSTIVGRAGLTIARNLQVQHLVASTPDEYVGIAINLSADLKQLDTMRQSLRARMLTCPLMDHARFARNMEDAYRAAWRNWCIGLSSDRAPMMIVDR